MSKLKIKKKRVSLNISASRGRRRMKHDSLEPPHRDESNGGSFVLLRSLDAEIIDETSTIRHLTFTFTAPFTVSLDISASSDHRRTKPPPFDSSR